MNVKADNTPPEIMLQIEPIGLQNLVISRHCVFYLEEDDAVRIIKYPW